MEVKKSANKKGAHLAREGRGGGWREPECGKEVGAAPGGIPQLKVLSNDTGGGE
jgi:hypothetical protein